MEYIINPRWFYIMNVVDGLKTTFIVLMATSLAGLIFYFIGKVMMVANEHYNRADRIDEDFLWGKSLCKVTKIFIFLCPIFLILTIFTPDKEAMIEILISKTVTVENAQWTVEALKEAVDYVIQGISSLK